MDQVKTGLFTVHGLIITVIHDLILAGVIFSFLFWQWMCGNVELTIGMPALPTMRSSHK